MKRQVCVHSVSNGPIYFIQMVDTRSLIYKRKKKQSPYRVDRLNSVHIVADGKREKDHASAIERTSIEDHRQNLIRSIPGANRISEDPEQSE